MAAIATRFSLNGAQLANKWQLYAIPQKLSAIGNGGPSLEDLAGFQESLQNHTALTPKRPTSLASTPLRGNKRPPSGKAFDLAKLEKE